MSTHNISFCGKIRKIFTGYPSLSRPMFKNNFSTNNVFQDPIRMGNFDEVSVYIVLWSNMKKIQCLIYSKYWDTLTSYHELILAACYSYSR